MQIVVTSNCQTHPIAQALQNFLPEYGIVSEWKLGGIDELRSKLRASISKQDFFWVTSCNDQEIELLSNEKWFKPHQIVRIPDIFFEAFHPDMTYFQLENGQIFESIVGPYHSKLIMWDFLQGKSVEDTLQDFTYETFERLGYLSGWDSSVEKLRASLSIGDLKPSTLDDFLLSKKNFMHSFNHPNQSVLTEVAVGVAEILNPGIEIEGLNSGLIEKDLLFFYGPVYAYLKPIANFFGEEGFNYFRNSEGKIFSLESYIEGLFSSYQSIGILEIQRYFNDLSYSFGANL